MQHSYHLSLYQMLFCQCSDISKICESLTPTNQYNLPQCLRCLKNIENNIPCSCIQCSDCSLYYLVGVDHKCAKKKNTCGKCYNSIISASKKCLYCELNAKNVVCADCPLTFNESNPVYCKCEKNVVGGRVKGETKNLILKYAFGMDKCTMDIYINTNQNELLTPHEFLLSKKHRIMDEINPLIKKHFTSCAKIYFYFSLKMQKLCEDSTYEYSET